MLNASVVQIKTILDTTRKVGGKIPKAVSDAVTQHDKLDTAINKIYIGGTALEDAVLAALQNDRDPASDHEVQRILTSRQIGHEGIIGSVLTTLRGRVVDTAALHAGDLVNSWRKPFDAAVDTIRETAAALGGIDLSDAQAILTRGGDAAEQWTRASQAVHRISEIIAAWTLLALQTGFAPHSNQLGVLRFTDPTLEQWEEHGLKERKLTAWEAHHLGLTLSLADGPEYAARTQRLEQQRQARAQAGRDQANGKRQFA